MVKNDDFLRALSTHPDDDGVRLVYADWLEENGNPERAEFIRAQIELNRYDPEDPARLPALSRQHTLLYKHNNAWRRELPPLPPNVEWGHFRRGFCDEIVAELRPELITLSDELLAT